MLVTSKAASEFHCPFLNRSCIGLDCMVFRQANTRDSHGNVQYFCGVGGKSGLWSASSRAYTSRAQGRPRADNEDNNSNDIL